jgi:molecular chaperone DnaK (HSP70)
MKGSAVVPAVSRDSLPFSLGIESASGLFIPIIHQGSEIPSEGSEVLTPATDDRASNDIHVYQGNRALARHNTLLGTFRFTHREPCFRYRTIIRITFRLDEQMLLHISTYEAGSASRHIQTASFQIKSDVDSEMDRSQDKDEVAYLKAKHAA